MKSILEWQMNLLASETSIISSAPAEDLSVGISKTQPARIFQCPLRLDLAALKNNSLMRALLI
jgi:hypothetical protein